MDTMDQVTLLYRVRRTVFQMLKARGYLVSEKRLAQTKQEFATWYNGSRDSLNMLVTKRKDAAGTAAGVEDPAEKLFVFFPDIEKLNEQTVKSIAKMMLDHNVFTSIIIVKGTT